jgi:hypothetical protein
MTSEHRSDSPATPHDEDELFLIEGVLDQLYVEDALDKLMARIDPQQQSKPTSKRVVVAAAAPFAQATGIIERTLVPSDPGEERDYFACRIEGQVVFGSFAGASKLKQGHRVKVAVSRVGEALHAHGILDPQQGYVWVHYPLGSAADAKAGRMFALWTFCFAYPCMAAMFWLIGPDGPDALELQLLPLISCVVLCGAMALTGNWGMLAPSETPTRIFGLLGFVDPQRVDLLQYRIWWVEMCKFRELIAANKKALRSGRMKPIAQPELLRESSDSTRHVHDYRQAIADGKAVVIR